MPESAVTLGRDWRSALWRQRVIVKLRSIHRCIAGSLAAAIVVGCTAPQAADSSLPMPSRSTEPSVGAPASVVPSEGAASPSPNSPTTGLEMTWAEQRLDGRIDDIAADGDRFVAVGGTAGVFASWTSTDGTTWEAVDVPPPNDFMEDSEGLPEDLEARGSRMGALARLDETLFSFGLFNFMDFVRPVGWRWTDGEPWAFIESDSAFYRSGRVADVVATDGSVVAARLELALGWAGADSTIWRWTPDASWVQADLSHPDADRVYITQLARSDGMLLATGLLPVGTAEDPDAALVAAWQSIDGQSWTAIEPPADADQICALEADPAGGFVAIGTGADGISAWRMTDGQWSGHGLSGTAPERQNIGEPYPDVCWVLPMAGGLVALFPTDEGVQAWTTADGSHWADVGIVASGAQLAAAVDDLLVLVRPVDHMDPEGGSVIVIGRAER